MYDSLEKLKNLDSRLDIYCGHEYSLANIEFALAIEPQNLAIRRWKDSIHKHGKVTVPGKLEHQRIVNPFLRCNDKHFAECVSELDPSVDTTDPVSVFAALRRMKDKF
ncbi:MAG: hypothetical protein IPJ88_01965 [Myxococcales bacterium]|nr:MAG: hypothetical protein IPJ88_01965 [Myxococcales bacterium]